MGVINISIKDWFRHQLVENPLNNTFIQENVVKPLADVNAEEKIRAIREAGTDLSVGGAKLIKDAELRRQKGIQRQISVGGERKG